MTIEDQLSELCENGAAVTFLQPDLEAWQVVIIDEETGEIEGESREDLLTALVDAADAYWLETAAATR